MQVGETAEAAALKAVAQSEAEVAETRGAPSASRADAAEGVGGVKARLGVKAADGESVQREVRLGAEARESPTPGAYKWHRLDTA